MFAVAAPLLVAEYGTTSERFRRWARWYRHAAVALALGLAVVLAARYLVVARPLIESVDFFFYVLNARDLLHGAANSLLARFVYFPGGYRFWEIVMALFGEELSTLQWTFVGVLAANALLVSAIVTRTSRSVAAGVLAALWYLALASRFEALYATTEPIATLFALTGLLCWGGMPLRGAEGWWRALLLGAGLGLALWVKQQGGFVAVGAAVLIVTNVMVDRKDRHSLWQIAAIPVASSLVFLVAVLFEGQGLRPISDGLSMVRQYEQVGSGFDNLRRVIRQMGIAGWGVLLALLLWGGTLAIPRLRRIHCEPSTAIVGFALIASIASLAQFAKRPYLHYGLLLAPFLAIAVIAAGARILRAVSATKLRAAPLVYIVMAGALTAPIIASQPTDEYFHAWPPSWNPQVAHESPWHLNTDIASDLQLLRPLVKPGDDLLLLPPRRNVVHFLLGSRSISGNGYGWGAGHAYEDLSSPTLDAVLILQKPTLDKDDMDACELYDCARAISALPERGFHRVAELKTMTLWRRAR